MWSSRRLRVAFCVAGLQLLAPCGFGAERVWRTSGYASFAKGTVEDGGANTYVAGDGSVRLINLRDLDGDGGIDIVFPPTHNNNEVIDVRVYTGAESGYSDGQMFELPSQGGQASAAADLNSDGWSDLVVANRFDGTKSDLNSFIYWGSPTGFSADRRQELPTVGSEAVAIADLNQDGHPDLVFANTGLLYHASVDRYRKSFIYWGSANGFSATNRLDLDSLQATDVTLADLNGDGQIEILLANHGNGRDDSGARIYWGKPDHDYAAARVVDLPGEGMSAVEAADLNGDGLLEIIVANSLRLKTQIGGIYNVVDTVAVDSCVYWASPEGYDAARRTLLPTQGAAGVAAGDLNQDGHPDLAFANRSGGQSFVYWGSADGFDAARVATLPIENATDCEIADLNGDGCADVVFTSEHDGTTHDTDSRIFWGSPQGVSPTAMTAVPTTGASDVAIAELDQTGRPELIFSQRCDGRSGGELPTWIYWSGQGDYSVERRTSLPSASPYHYLIADIDLDDAPDIVIGGRKTFVYHGQNTQEFRIDERDVLTEKTSFGTVAADFNRDGRLDVLAAEWDAGVDDMTLFFAGPNGFSKDNSFVFRIASADRLNWPTVADFNGDGWPDLVVPTWKGVVIYTNGPQGFDNERKTVLPAAEAVIAEVADLNGDGHLDIIVANLFDTHAAPGKPQSFGGTSEADTYLYWGAADGFNPQRRQVLPSVGNADIAVADLNRDGRLDLVLSSYHAGYTRSHPSYIYWNGASGFDAKNVTLLPTNSASGVLVADFNQDGEPDILFACHSKNGNHRTDSYLYWNQRGEFSDARRTLLPSEGVHYLSVVDAGHIRDRGDRYGYISAPYNAGSGAQFKSIEWQAVTPHRTRIEFQVRTAADEAALAQAPWRGPEGANSAYATSGAALAAIPANHRWIQYRAVLVSPDSVNTPILKDVAIRFEQ